MDKTRDASKTMTKKAEQVKANFSSANVMHKCKAYDQGELKNTYPNTLC